MTIPLAVTLSPFYSSFANFAAKARAGGADGLVLFNRFYQPDLDLELLEVCPACGLDVQLVTVAWPRSGKLRGDARDVRRHWL